jgi:serine protease inhibitor
LSNQVKKYLKKTYKISIHVLLVSDDLFNANMVLTSALYFRGSWKDAFNETLTRREPFMDDNGVTVAEVDMMYQVGRFRLSFIDGLKAIALELPYSVSFKKIFYHFIKLKSKCQFTFKISLKIHLKTLSGEQNMR